MNSTIKRGDYVLTSRNKLGYIVEEGKTILPKEEFGSPRYTPFKVSLGDNTFEIWGDNLRKVDNLVITFNHENLILTAPQAFQLVKMLIRSRIKGFKLEDLKIK